MMEGAVEPVRVIRPAGGAADLRLAELWAHRELFGFLVRRDVKLRYKQTTLGVLWAVLQPALAMVVFTLVFGRFARIPSDGVPYAVFAYAGLVPWMFFAAAIAQASQSLVAGANLVTKVYFPRAILPAAAVASCALDFAVAFGLLALLMPFYGVVPGSALVAFPLFLVLLLLVAAGTGAWLAALNVTFRDIRYVVPFLTQFWLFVTPVIYPASVLPEALRPIAGLNPMAGVVEGFRWTLLGAPRPSTGLLALSAAAGLAVFVTGVLYFRRVEDHVADTV
ncbi:MAG TPA: ABC transporter permease [Terriglobales bacterium]|nr:ABC transporter permease [Terriglobales bacterium]